MNGLRRVVEKFIDPHSKNGYPGRIIGRMLVSSGKKEFFHRDVIVLGQFDFDRVFWGPFAVFVHLKCTYTDSNGLGHLFPAFLSSQRTKPITHLFLHSIT